MTRTTLIIGGTGAQGSTVARILARSGKYTIKILTRDLQSPQAVAVASIPNVSIIEGSFTNERDIITALQGVDSIYVNTNGFAIGEKAETHYGIRIFELARREGVKHFVYAGLDYLGPLTNYADKYHVGHYEGKGRVGAYMTSQPTSPMAWTNILSGPYMETLNEVLRPTLAPDGTYVFAAPLKTGALPLIHLEDLGRYTLWALENPSLSNGLTFGAATEHVSWSYLAATFTEVTGKRAIYRDITLGQWIEMVWGSARGPLKIGQGFAGPGDESLLSFEQNFGAWWELYRASGGNKGIIKRDYEFLDRILPGRVKSLSEWMKLTGYDGSQRKVLKGIS